MKSTKLTLKILKTLDPTTILYAEFAEGGAMGDCGTARIFALDGDKLKFYLIDDIFNNKSNEKIWGATIEYLNDLSAQGTLIHAPGGFGNHAYKPPKVEFTRDDDHASFVYVKAGKSYHIPASCNGVYGHVVAKFAARMATIEDIENYLEQIRFDMTISEIYFYEQYIAQIKRVDSGQGWFDFTPFDYYNAVKYLLHLSGEDYMLNPGEIHDGRNALAKYRLDYIVKKLGWNRLDAIFVSLIESNSADLFAKIAKLLKQNPHKIYSQLKTIKSSYTKTKVLDSDNLEHLFDSPVLVDFTPVAHKTIIKDIMNRSGNSFNPDARSIAYYLANYLLNEHKLPFTDILPATVHIATTMPDDDFNHTHTEQLFYLCGEIIDHAWRYLEENDATQKKYRDMVYEIYWPRVGSLWPILNRNKFKFTHESADKIFDDSASFVMSLNDITERNPEVKVFLDIHAKNINYNAGPLGRRAFCYTLRDLKPSQEFEAILSSIEPCDYHSFLTYPDGIPEAKLLLTELFRTDQNARITGEPRLATFESLVITPNTIGVGEYILTYIDQHFTEFVGIVSNEATALSYEPTQLLTDLFIAMSKGISEENEFPPFKSLQQKLSQLGCDKVKLDHAAKYARKHRRTILLQRSALQKFF